MALKDFLDYKQYYYHRSLSDNKQKYFMKAVINALEVILTQLDIVSRKQVKFEREIRQIKSQVDNIFINSRKILNNFRK